MPSLKTGASSANATEPPHAQPNTNASDETRERIIRAAARLFSEQGYAATSVKQIAAAVKVSAPALYWHFSSKSDLLHAVIQSTLTRFLASARAAVAEAGTEPHDQLAAIVRMYVRIQLTEVDDVAAYSSLYAPGHLFTHLPKEAHDELRTLEAEVFNVIRLPINSGIERGVFTAPSATVAAHAIVGVIENLPVWTRQIDSPDEDRLVRAHLEIAERIVGIADGSTITGPPTRGASPTQ